MGKELVEIVKNICAEEKITLHTYSSDYILQLEANKRIMFIFGNKFPNNNAAIEKICDDKAALSDILEHYNIPHVPHYLFYSFLSEQNIRENGNWPDMIKLLKKYDAVVCKNNRGTGGTSVYKATNQKELEFAVEKIFNSSKSLCISPYYDIENEYRVIVVSNEYQYAFRKVRPHVIGDGVSSLIELINQSEYKDRLKSLKDFDLDSIPEKNEKVLLSWKHNLGQGATPELVKDSKLKEKLFNLAKRCISYLDMGFVSVDVVEVSGTLQVLEINSGIMIEKFSQYSEECYELAKKAVKKAIEEYLHLDMKYKLTSRKKKHFVLPVLTKIAKKKKVDIIEDVEEQNFAIFSFPNGKKFVARDFPFNINDGGSTALCTNKSACCSFISYLNYSCPKEKYFVRKSNRSKSVKKIEAALENMDKELGFTFPIVVKPYNQSQGKGVRVVRNQQECIEAAEDAFMISEIVILQEYCVGKEYRIVVLGKEILQAYQRIPFYICGDGAKTIEELIDDKIKSFDDYGRDVSVNKNDFRIYKNIAREGYDTNAILEDGKILRLQDIANISLGGESIDVLNDVDDKFKDMAISIADSFNLRLCGIDIIADDISNFDLGYKILEINSSPGLDNYLYPKEQQEKYVESLYSRVMDEIGKHN